MASATPSRVSNGAAGVDLFISSGQVPSPVNITPVNSPTHAIHAPPNSAVVINPPNNQTASPSDSGSSAVPSPAQQASTVNGLSIGVGREIVGPYLIGPTIGKGIFAKVKLGEDEYRQKVAIKVFDKQLLSRSKHQLQQVEKEINALRVCSHPNIVQFYEVLETDTRVYLVMEHLPHGELYDYILDKGRLEEEEGGRLFWQICSALRHCHERGICHRDLKPENILLDPTYSVKLVDFGLANYFDIQNEKDAKSLRTQCGSPHYAAPEILTGSRYNGCKADIWSLGILLYAILAGTLPFNARSIPLLIKKILEGKYKFPKFLSSSARHLISSILQLDPEKRPSVAEILTHPWVTQYSPTSTNGQQSRETVTHQTPIRASNKVTPSRPEIISPESLPAHAQYQTAKRPLPSVNSAAAESSALSPAMNAANSALAPSSMMSFPSNPMHTSAPIDAVALLKHNKAIIDKANAASVAPGAGAQSSASPPYSFSLHSAEQKSGDLSSSPQHSRPQIVCKTCGKNLKVRIADNGAFLISLPNQQAKSQLDAAAAQGLCTCQQPAIDDEKTQQFPVSFITNNASAAAPGGSLLAPPNAPNAEQRGVVYETFELGSFRENYFRSDDKLRKSNLTALAQTDARARRRLEDEKLNDQRRKLEEKLIHAAETGDAQTVQQLINDSTPLNSNNSDVNGQTNSNRVFIAIDLRARTIDNMTALHLASRNGHMEIVQALLSSVLPLDLNSRTKSGWSSLMLAADRGHLEVCKLLLRYGAAIHITNGDGKSAIFLARESGHGEIAHLLTNASSLRHRRHTANHGSLSERSLNVEFLRACECGDVTKVRHLLSLTQKEMEKGAAELAQAAAAKAEKTEKQRRSFVIPSRIDPNGFFNRDANQYVIDIYARGIDNWSALHFAARKGRTAILELLLSCRPPAEVNALTKNGWTPLMMACDRGQFECARMLLDGGADVNIRSSDNCTAWSVAKEGQYDDLLELLYPVVYSLSAPAMQQHYQKLQQQMESAARVTHLPIVQPQQAMSPPPEEELADQEDDVDAEGDASSGGQVPAALLSKGQATEGDMKSSATRAAANSNLTSLLNNRAKPGQ